MADTRVIRKHTKNCKAHHMVYVGASLQWGDSIGRKNAAGGSTYWLPLVCNDPTCDARVLVKASLLSNYADTAMVPYEI